MGPHTYRVLLQRTPCTLLSLVKVQNNDKRNINKYGKKTTFTYKCHTPTPYSSKYFLFNFNIFSFLCKDIFKVVTAEVKFTWEGVSIIWRTKSAKRKKDVNKKYVCSLTHKPKSRINTFYFGLTKSNVVHSFFFRKLQENTLKVRQIK